jgi:hypothetical protein
MVSAFNPYNTLPVADEALDLGGVELLRAGFADKRLFVSLHRHAIETPDQWGEVLAEVTLNLATLYSANGDFTENDVIAAVAAGFRDSLRQYLESSPSPAGKGTARSKAPTKAPSKMPAKGKAKVLAKSKAKAKTPLKAKAKSPAGKQPLVQKPLAKKSLVNKKSLVKSPAKSKSASKAVAGRKGARS